ncbi:MAG: carbonic anhydrase [Candidatus Micrarchaeota archaeon]|nr:carbonic anhydrase [Candidatus Micrarchaeota archaeon]
MEKTISSQEALELLKEGNKRYVQGTMLQKDFNSKRKELLGFQKPFAIILSCSDSRVVPEFIFDTNIGELFVIRNAGNLAVDKTILGSLEYGAAHLHSALIVILAHQSCGAVCASCDCRGKSQEGNIKYIVKAIAPAAKKSNYEKEKAIIESAKNTAAIILKKSKIISDLYNKGKLNIVVGYYSFEDGSVKFF